MRERSIRALILALVGILALTGALAGSVWFLGHDSQARLAAGLYAEKAAKALAAGTLPEGLQSTDRAALEADYAKVLAGMGKLRPVVKVASVVLDKGERRGTITFDQSWKIHADKAAWTYQSTMPIAAITRAEGVEWVGTWSHEVIAKGLRDEEVLNAVREVAVRGDILDGDQDPLVMPRPVTRVGLDKQREPDAKVLAASAKSLARRVGIDPSAYAAAVAAAGPKAFVEAIVYRDEARELIGIAEDAKDFPGLRLLPDELPLAPTARFARPLLGTVGQATAEMIQKSGGSLRAGTIVGLSGLQQSMNERLGGRDGFTVQALMVGASPRDLYAVPARQGLPVATTLDPVIQEAAELALDQVSKRGASALVAIRPTDMHILAAASGAGSEGYSTATLGQYPPGSTFKPVTALALLRAGLRPSSPVPCNKSSIIDGRTFTNYSDYPNSARGSIPLVTAIANSCNTAMISATRSLAADSLAQAAAAVGLTAPPAAGIPAALGAVPTDGGRVDFAAASIGQGKVVATPLGMATVAAAIARGEPGSPVFVTEPATEPAPIAGRPITADEAKSLRSMMRAVVTEGSARFLASVPGKPVMAKTGTAEYGSGNPPPTHAWMIAIQGDLAVAVFVEKGESGSRTAGPVLEDFLRRIAR